MGEYLYAPDVPAAGSPVDRAKALVLDLARRQYERGRNGQDFNGDVLAGGVVGSLLAEGWTAPAGTAPFGCGEKQ